MSDGMNKPNSEETGRLIDDEVKRIVDEQWERTYNLLSEKKDILEKLALQLLEKETIERQDLIECLGKFLKASTLIATVFFYENCQKKALLLDTRIIISFRRATIQRNDYL